MGLEDVEFDWDEGNWPKCGKHGVTKAEIEHIVRGARYVVDDPNPTEKRLRTFGVTEDKRYVFVVFALRYFGELIKARPISARYMHDKEVKAYEEGMAQLEKRRGS